MSDDLPRLTTSPSIHEFLAARIDESGRLPSSLTLPDEVPESDGIRWAAGALDGVFGSGGGATGAQARRLAALVAKAAAKPSRRRLRRLLNARHDNALEWVDQMMERLVELDPPVEGVRRVGRWLAATATDRGAVKLGIALIGLTGVGDSAGLLRTLGAHDEFTLYAAVAFGNGAEDTESEIWSLARAVDGWGRIQCVERLRETTDPAIRQWILRTGFRNSVMYEYLAYVAATTGGLLEALRGGFDRELLDAANDIITALIEDGPAENLDDWADGADAIEAYLSMLTSHAETVDDYLGVAAVRDYLARDDGWDQRSARGWTATRRAALETACADLLGRPGGASWQRRRFARPIGRPRGGATRCCATSV